MAFPKEAREFMDAHYAQAGVTTDAQKWVHLEEELGGTWNYHAMGAPVTDRLKVACLEYEFLLRHNKIQPVFC